MIASQSSEGIRDDQLDDLAAGSEHNVLFTYIKAGLDLAPPANLPEDVVQIVWASAGLDALDLAVTGRHLILGLTNDLRESVALESAFDRLSPFSAIFAPCASRELPVARQPDLLMINEMSAFSLLRDAISQFDMPDRIAVGPQVLTLFKDQIGYLTKHVGDLGAGWELYIRAPAFKAAQWRRDVARLIRVLAQEADRTMKAQRSEILGYLRAKEWEVAMARLEQISAASCVMILQRREMVPLWRDLSYQLPERVAAMAPFLLARMPKAPVAEPILRACVESSLNAQAALCWLLSSGELDTMPDLICEIVPLATENLIAQGELSSWGAILAYLSTQAGNDVSAQIIRGFVSSIVRADLCGECAHEGFTSALQLASEYFEDDRLVTALLAASALRQLCSSRKSLDHIWKSATKNRAIQEDDLCVALPTNTHRETLKAVQYLKEAQQRRVVFWSTPHRHWAGLLDACAISLDIRDFSAAYARFLLGWADLMADEIERGSAFWYETPIVCPADSVGGPSSTCRLPLDVLCLTVLDSRVARIERCLRERAILAT